MRRIAVAGAGIAGLAAAIALRRHGFEPVVFEQARELGEVGAGLQVSPNGTRVLQALGVDRALQPLACEARGKEIRLWRTGQRWTLFDLGEDCRRRFGAPYWMVHRADLHAVLAQGLERESPGALRLGSRVIQAEQHATGVLLTLQDGSTVDCEALVAADGVHSSLRPQGAEPERASYTGLTAWRGLVPWERVPPSLRDLVGSNWVGPGGHAITYPVRAGRLMNVVGIVERQGDWGEESWTRAGTREAMLADFAGWHPDLLALMGAIAQPFEWALLARAPRRPWCSGRVCAIGDAAHPALPFLAQGANMALEDAWVLAACLHAEADPAAAFRRFEALRWDRAAAVVDRSRENAARFHHRELADPALAAAYIDREWQPEKVRTRYDWLFEYDATAVLPRR